MIIYHRGAAFEPFVSRVGTAFMAKASILEEDGHLTSLGDLGVFANEESAFKFAVYSATAFIEGEQLPTPASQRYTA
ncbi:MULTISPECIES: hypothetical protein [unclassified Caballeronia]|uniref:hypothetical protein n=1 Tax=unclassified Caballeronia TaxID=2646786 RepID=UPI00286314B4|nr:MULTISPECIES: hypothetical protein [unclassified Caballeronia]MDR5741296.1 hypothetical protein [Caballeronia sp. LZ016]MDR5807193.1 hypothetical protein [Caballeronia sp. LZ019]